MNPKPRLLFFENNPAYFLSHRLPLARAAQGLGFEVQVASMPGKSTREIESAGFAVHTVRMHRSRMNPFAELLTLLRIRRLYRKLRPDLVYQVTAKPVIYGMLAARSTQVPHVVSVVSGLGHAATRPGIKGWILRHMLFWLYRFALRHPSQKVIFHNRDDRDLFVSKRMVKPADAAVVPGSGVDMEYFSPQAEPEGIPRILFPSRVLRDKGAVEFAGAAASLRAAGVQAQFVIAGGTDPGNPSALSEAQLRRWVAEGIIEWLGHARDMRALYAQVHIVCLPSYREGLPKALIEAAACGRPVVTTDVPGCREVLIDGETGLRVPARDTAALAAALKRLIEDRDLRRRMGNAGRRYVAARFSTAQVIAQTSAIFTALLPLPSGSAAHSANP
ncbi:MAG: glycosyltransferase family 4 protein [Gammaproteobacteria bacterium]|nr:glycosyltransferase family 4 protein [Gammaproteobacteria bacterium]MDE1984601.1 glycosyltransferase family 4 protein [Gammaproteobacteria bacterium]